MKIRVTAEYLEDTGAMPSSWDYITPDEYMGLLTLPEQPSHEMVYVLVSDKDFPIAQLPHPSEMLCKRWESKLEYFKSNEEPHEQSKLTEAEAKLIEDRRHNNNDSIEIDSSFFDNLY